MYNIQNRNASLKTVLSYCEPNLKPKLFFGEINGYIASLEYGTNGFGYDSIFEYKNKTLGEITINEKNKISGRSQAFIKFIEWYYKNKLL